MPGPRVCVFFPLTGCGFYVAGRACPAPTKASPEGLRPQARVGAQPPEAALSAETEAVARRRLMRAESTAASRSRVLAARPPLIRPRSGPRPPSPKGGRLLSQKRGQLFCQPLHRPASVADGVLFRRGQLGIAAVLGVGAAAIGRAVCIGDEQRVIAKAVIPIL